MKIAIHQPEFMPWLGFFYKMALADTYVVLDHVQFKKRYFDNRNRIVSPRKEVSYAVAPVLSKGRHAQPIMNTELDNTQNWKEVLLKKIKYFYSKARYFDKYYASFYSVLKEKEHHHLIDLNIDIIDFFRSSLGISTPMFFSSRMNVQAYRGSDLILQICLLNESSVYLCGPSGRDYLKTDDFSKRGINIEWLEYKSPEYSQLGDGFIPNMSTLDLLFNHGGESLNILMNVPQKKGVSTLCIY